MSSRIIAVQLDKHTVIYMEASEETAGFPENPDPVILPQDASDDAEEKNEVLVETRQAGTRKKTASPASGRRRSAARFETIHSTICSFADYSLRSFKDVALANVDKVTLEFGVKVAGEAGIPLITRGNGDSNLKVTVECSFPEKAKAGKNLHHATRSEQVKALASAK